MKIRNSLLMQGPRVLEGKAEVAGKQPPAASTPVLRVVASRGEEVQISCPVDGNPQPIVEWSKVGGWEYIYPRKGLCHEMVARLSTS